MRLGSSVRSPAFVACKLWALTFLPPCISQSSASSSTFSRSATLPKAAPLPPALRWKATFSVGMISS